MLQEEQISNLTKLKELLDAGILSEDEFAQEKAKVLSKPEIRPHQPEPATTSVQKPARETPLTTTADISIGPANVDLSPRIVLPLGFLAIIVSLLSALFFTEAELGDSDYFLYRGVTCSLLAAAADLIMWICAFKKLSKMPEGKRLGRIPLWTYLYFGTSFLTFLIVLFADRRGLEGFILTSAPVLLGYVAFISLYQAYSGKMRTYSIAWMIAEALSSVIPLLYFGNSFVSIMDVGLYALLMITLLEKKSITRLTNE